MEVDIYSLVCFMLQIQSELPDFELLSALKERRRFKDDSYLLLLSVGLFSFLSHISSRWAFCSSW